MANTSNRRKTNPPKKNNTASSTESPQLLLARQSDGATTSTKEQTSSTNSPTEPFPIVGIGASAGGLAAFEAFFSGMPAETDPDMAFVLVQHLAPDHKSILTGLIQRTTRMQVSEVEDGMKVQPNCAYIIPPGKDMAFKDGSLRLLEPDAPRGRRLPIDFFFRSLARDQRERAICIVLAGTGSDGTQGVREIKGEGGMAMAQSPGSTEYDGMPKSAIATGLIDYELPPAEMVVQLINYAAQAFNGADELSSPTTKDDNIRTTIFNVLQKETGHDFSQYKPSTIARRLTRRMAVHQIETLQDYADYLRQTPAEVKALFSDLLINVTSFFRDPEAFTALAENVIPTLFADRAAGDPVRIWSQGCSTGEEAYSLAILLQEHLNTLKQSHMVQIFATDIDHKAIATARAGLYPASIAADVSAERLALFFTLEADNTTYRINKSIRDMVIFSEQDVIKDPPFSRLDLLCCRNLLIYMTSNLQKKIIPLFHFALKPDGFLFLGSSETAGGYTDMFAVFDKKSKIYRRKQGVKGFYQTAAPDHNVPTTPTTAIEDRGQPLPAWKRVGPGRLSLRELTEQALLQQVAPTGALINTRGDILYLHGRTGMYLEPTPGEVAVNNILEMAREGLQHEMASALHQASTAQETARRPGLRVSSNGAIITVNLTISPMITGPTTSIEAPLYLVILEEVIPLEPAATTADDDGPTPAADVDKSVYIASLRQELRAKEQFLQIANEELKSTIEEMQSINEELQSSNEELETSKEELQSTNEELATVNAELQSNVTDLTRVNNDMNNMVAGTGIGTVFVDHRLRVLRFTPDLTRIINLIQTDVGRPIGHIVSNMKGYDHLVADVQSVLDSLVPMEKDVQTLDGLWYAMRIHPYRTTTNAIEGAVISFIDITKRRRAEVALKKAFDEIHTLRGIIPICAKCKQIRDDKGFWSQVEVYIKNHTGAEFSHGICPECAKELYPELDEEPPET
jgi:two-component system, chemotaxis family, CheB/CheR fusion protein